MGHRLTSWDCSNHKCRSTEEPFELDLLRAGDSAAVLSQVEDIRTAQVGKGWELTAKVKPITGRDSAVAVSGPLAGVWVVTPTALAAGKPRRIRAIGGPLPGVGVPIDAAGQPGRVAGGETRD